MQSPDWKKPLGLAAALVVLSGGAYWLEFNKKPADQKKENMTKQVFDLHGRAVSKIALNDEHGVIASFECASAAANLCKPGDHSQWNLTYPLAANADEANVNSFLSAMESLTATEIIDFTQDDATKRQQALTEYRLSTGAPQRSIEITLVGGTKQIAVFGVKHPIGDSYFVATTDGQNLRTDRVLLVPGFQDTHFTHPIVYWRNKRILSLNQSDIDGFTLAGGKDSKTPVIAKKEKAVWHVHSGNQTIVGELDATDSFLNSIVFLNAKGFAEEKKESAAGKKLLASAQPRLHLTLNHGTAQDSLTFFERKFRDGKKEATQLYLTAEGRDAVYELDTTALSRFDFGLKNFRVAKLVSQLDRFNVKKIVVTQEGKSGFASTTSRAAEEWKSDTVKDVDSGRVSDFMDRLTSNSVAEYLSPAPTAPASAIKVELFDAQSKPLAELRFWKNAAGKIIARDLRSTENEAFLLRGEIETLIPFQKEFFSHSFPLPKASNVSMDAPTAEHEGHEGE